MECSGQKLRLKDDSLEDSKNLPDPVILAKAIVDNSENALEQFESISEELAVK